MTDMDAVQFHDALADEWEGKYTRATFGRRADALMEMAGTDSLQGRHWLDAGCGSGTIARRLAQFGCRVTAVDGSARMVAVTQRLMSIGNYAYAPQCAQITDIAMLPFPDAGFDGVMCSSVLEYVEDPGSALLELARVLRPGGRLIISVPNRRSWLRRAQKLTYWATSVLGMEPRPAYIRLSRHEYSVPECIRLLESSGFTHEGWRYYGPGQSRAMSINRYTGTLLIVAAQKPA